MAEATCRVCGCSFEVQSSRTDPAEKSFPRADPPVCPACQEHLAAERIAKGLSRSTGSTALHSGEERKEPFADRAKEKPEVPPEAPKAAISEAKPGSSLRPESAAPVVPERSASPAPEAGKIFGNYEILEEISRGSFGVVYRARQRGLERIVALKVLLAGTHASLEAIARFQREARAAARLKHPCIVPIYEIGVQEGHHYFAMEFVEGRALSKLIARKELGIPDALRVAESLADAMEMAHNEGVIHRDLKPSNIIMDPRGQAHITDFGLAKQVDLDTQYTQSGTTLGTPAYMPPEQARGELDRIDRRSDVYALGAVLYEMLTGQPPFAGRSLLEVVVAVINEPVKPPRQINAKIHRDIQTIVMKCLEKMRRNRYASAGELRDDIRRFRSGEAIRAKPVGVLRRAGRLFKQQSLFLSAVAIVLLAVGVSVWQIHKIKRQSRQATQHEKEKMRRELQAEQQAATRPVWKKFWWWPLREEDVVPAEQRPLFQKGLVYSRREAYDLSGSGTRPIRFIQRNRVSPSGKLIFGDLDARIAFHLTKEAARRGVRIGLQSYDGGVPYVLTIQPGRLALCAPLNLYNTTDLARKLRLRVKAEKEGPPLQAGPYRLRILREGMYLSFELLPPAPAHPVKLMAWDAGLSHWRFKNTQLTVRDAPRGFTLDSIRVDVKFTPRLDELGQALSKFHDGDYNVAEAKFDALAEEQNLSSAAERLRAAKALYYLGLIQEICHPASGGDWNFYAQALDALDKCPESPQRRLLAGRIHLRRLVRAASFPSKWKYLSDETRSLARVAAGLARFPESGSGLREPFGWELQELVLQSLRRKDKQGYETALGLFKLMGLPPGSRLLGQAARDLGLVLAADNRAEDLKALHQAYPTRHLLQAFVNVIHLAIDHKERQAALASLAYAARHFKGKQGDPYLVKAGAQLMGLCVAEGDLDAALETLQQIPRIELLNALGAALAKDAPKRLDAGLGKILHLLQKAARIVKPGEAAAAPLSRGSLALCRALVEAQRPLDVRKVHQAWPDPKLAPAFAQAVQALSISPDARAVTQAIELLAYCRAAVNPRDGNVARAAFNLASRKKRIDADNSYLIMLDVQRAYPTAELLKLAQDVLKELVARERYLTALEFFGAARGVFPEGGETLRPYAVEALSRLEGNNRDEVLATLRNTVQTALEKKPAEARRWRLEFADLLWAAGDERRAESAYQELYESPGVEADLRARVALRLGALRAAQNPSAAARIWLELKDRPAFPEEAKLAGRLLAGVISLSELEGELPRVGAPTLFSKAEWEVIRALRLNADQHFKQALKVLKGAAQETKEKRGWPYSFFQRLVPAGSESAGPEAPPGPAQ